MIIVTRKGLSVVLALVLALLLMATPAALADPGTSVAIDDGLDVAVGGNTDVDIIITTDDPQGIGSATITLTVDTSVVSVSGVTAGDLGAINANTAGSTTTIVSWTGGSSGPTGIVTFCTVTLHAEGSEGECSVLGIEVTSMYDGTVGNPQEITPSPVVDGTFCIHEGGVGTSAAIECGSSQEGGSDTVDITITTEDPAGIGSATITLTVDTAVVSVGNVVGGDLGSVTYNTVGDTTIMVAAYGGPTPGPGWDGSTVTFATVTLNAVGNSGDSSSLDIEVTSLYDGTAGNPQLIYPSPVTDCTFDIGGRQKGDVLWDDTINSADMQLVAQHIVHTTTLTGDAFTAADVNCTGTVDSADMQLIAQYLVETITDFPC